jgi:mannitol-specific phosphotransferase system IIBC component
MDKKVIRSWAGATVMLPGMVVAASAMQSGQPGVVGLIAAVVFACLVALPVGALMIVQSRREDRPSS